MVMPNSVHMAKVTWNFTSQSTHRENTKLKCSEISILQNCQIKTQLKYSVLQYIIMKGFGCKDYLKSGTFQQ